VYGASKSGLIGLMKNLAVTNGKFNIRVNCLTPGGVWDNHEKTFHKNYKERVPLNRMANWTDYNGAIIFLASDASRYMTGSNLVIDGGWTAW
jgi:NAD(P)-dependent dehydrogenase (short-subunit alcohol dehydrogenase family)